MRPSSRVAALLAGLIVLAVLAAAAVRLPWRTPDAKTALQAPSPVDIGFAQSMSLHHQQAIGMAQMMLDGRPTPLASMARSIATAQLVELGEMRGWLRIWGQPLQRPARDMGWMLLGERPPDAALSQYLLDCQRSPTGMAGLASDADLARLRRLEGRERDALFLALMRAHHEGGLPMARFAAAEAQHPVVRQLARRVVLEQSEEVVRILRTQQALMAAGPAAAVP